MAVAGAHNDLTDVAGIRVGHHHRLEPGWGTGTTVVLTPPGTVGSVDVRGGGPATRETDALGPDTMVQHVDGICLTGGSAYGLDAAGGVQRFLEARGRGFSVGADPSAVVPIVGAAALFDLGVLGAFGHRPDASFGEQAADAAATSADAGDPFAPSALRIVQGSVGAGAGATAGMLRGGIGSASVVLDSGATVAALVAVNAAGSPVDPTTGDLWGRRHGLPGEFDHLATPNATDVNAHRDRLAAWIAARTAPFNTTLAVLATDAVLTKPECRRLAGAGHDGMARSLDPIHGYVDGDVVFGLATGQVPLGADGDPLVPVGRRLHHLGAVLAAAADAVARAVVHATLAAASTGSTGSGDPTPPSYLDLFPSVAASR
jgi:putative pantetheine hydrolase